MQKFPTNIPQSATRNHYLTRIQNQYKNKGNMHPNDHHIFDLAEDAWQQQSTTAMRTWLSYSQPFIAYCLKNRNYQAINNTRDIRTYMQGKTKTKVPKIYTTKKKTKKAKTKKRRHQIQTIDIYFQVNATKDTRNMRREINKPKIHKTQASRTTTQHKDDRQTTQERHKQPSRNLSSQETQNRQSIQNIKVESARLRPQPKDI